MSPDAFVAKYRPKKLSEIIGQHVAVSIIGNSIKSGDIHHAYLFSGYAGCGKTTLSRVFAATLNSSDPTSLNVDTGEEHIKEILDGTSIDVKEIDAASNRGIDEIRELKESLSYSPLKCKYKFVILDEAHALTPIAADSLLKILEEPPPNTIFLLATTDPQKLKPTIHSRCIQVKLVKPNWDTIVSHLGNICLKENIKFDNPSLTLIAKKSKGSVRNAIQSLQTIINASENRSISLDVTKQVLGRVEDNIMYKFFDEILKLDIDGRPDVAPAMITANNMLNSGMSIADIMEEMSEYIKNMIIISTCKNTDNLLFLSEEEIKKLLYQKQKTKLQVILYVIDIMRDICRGNTLNLNSEMLMAEFISKVAIYNSVANKPEKK